MTITILNSYKTEKTNLSEKVENHWTYQVYASMKLNHIKRFITQENIWNQYLLINK